MIGSLLAIELAAAAQVKRPDLVVTVVANPPSQASPGSAFRLSSTVKNRGRKRAPSSTNRYYLSRDRRRDRNDIRLLGRRAMPALARGAKSTGRVQLTIPTDAPLRAYFVVVCADDLKKIRELSESNNCRASALKMTIAEGQVGAIANQILALDQRVPSNIDLFTSVFPNGTEGFYPDGSGMAPDSDPLPTEEEVRAQLTTHLNDWFNNDSVKVNEALALFDDPQVEELIPDAIPRAAYAAMKGTLLEPTIDHFRENDRFLLVRYGSLPDSTATAASTGGDTNRVITINSRYASDDFRYLIGTMGHEILHDDPTTPRSEEAILGALTSMTRLQVLLKNPELAYAGTELSRKSNDSALIFLNSKEDGSPNSEIYAPTGNGIAPGSPRDAPDYWTERDGSGSSPAPGPLSEILVNLGLPAATEFSQATAETFEDLSDEWITDQGRLQISVLLQMVTVEEISQETGLSEQDVIDLLELQPYLDAMS